MWWVLFASRAILLGRIGDQQGKNGRSDCHSFSRSLWRSDGIAIQLQGIAQIVFFGSNLVDMNFCFRRCSISLSSIDYCCCSFAIFHYSASFYFLLYKKPYSYRSKKGKATVSENDLPPVSVVIVSKNDSENLAKHLPAILNQEYPDFEVVVVNMGSTDETDMVLKCLEQSYDNLYHTYVPQEAEEWNEKKLALTLGIKAAKTMFCFSRNLIVGSVSNRWIKEFAAEFAEGKEVVLGFCKLDIPKKVFMRRFIHYDNLIQGMKYLSMAIVHRPFMGIGRNMAYTKDLFFKQKDFHRF